MAPDPAFAQRLAGVLERAYPDSLTHVILAREFAALRAARPVTQEEVAELILHIAETAHREWPLETILSALNDAVDGINWRGVYESFATSSVRIWNTAYLYTFVDCWVHISGIITMPYEAFFHPWTDRNAQIGFLRTLLDSDPRRTQVYANIFFERLVTKEDLQQARHRGALEYESTLNAKELFRCIADLGADEVLDAARACSPEYCLLGLLAVRPYGAAVFDALLAAQCEAGPTGLVYQLLFARDRAAMFAALERVRGRVSLSRVLDVLLEHRMLPAMVEALEPRRLAFDVVVLAARREHLNLEVWLANGLGAAADDFVAFLAAAAGTGHALPPDSELFPLTREIVAVAVRAFEHRELSAAAAAQLQTLRAQLGAEGAAAAFSSDRAVAFISEIINSHAEVDESVQRIRGLLAGDESSALFAKRIFGLLVDNYSSLYQLPNSDVLAQFFGELVRQRVLVRPFVRMTLQLVRGSLVAPANDREFAFAFRILEVFFTEMPEFFAEVEGVAAVRDGLIKKELIIVDEEAAAVTPLATLLEHVLNHGGAAGAAPPARAHAATASALLLRLPADGACAVAEAVHAQSAAFRDFFLETAFELVRASFIHRVADEAAFFGALGSLLGMLTVARNQAVPLDQFDFRAHLLKCIEYRRISPGVAFVAAFFREGARGITCVPRSPWLMSILNLLAELYPCTLATVRTVIAAAFAHFALPLPRRPAFRTREHLVKYALALEGAPRQVVAAALDFSVREVCGKIVRASVGVAKTAAAEVFRRLPRPAGEESPFFFFRNLLANLARALTHVSAQEPLRASMCGNITHFLKLSGCEMSLEDVQAVAADNLRVCCELVEKVAITQACEAAPTLFAGLHAGAGANAGAARLASLRITAEMHFVEKTHVRPIENAEYQEIRSFLVQFGRRGPAAARDVVAEEWPLLLGHAGAAHFARMLAFLESAPDRDAQCLGLCKYLVGHALRTGCAASCLFDYLARLLALSPRAKREVVGWLVYADDRKRYDIPLICRFIEHDLLRLSEYDQALTRLLSSEEARALPFVLELLTTLVLGPVRLCTAYDFIHTIEMLNRVNDDPRVYAFFKALEGGMLRISEGNDALFDEFLARARIDVAPRHVLGLFQEYARRHAGGRRFCFAGALRAAWHHYVLYGGAYRHYKVDVLAYLAREDTAARVREALALFVQAYTKQHYLFCAFFGRFFCALLDALEDTPEMRALVQRVVEALAPSRVPAFATQYLRILEHRFTARLLERPEGFVLLRELISLVGHDRRYEPLLARFFARCPAAARRHGVYLLFLCPMDAPQLKNALNQARLRGAAEKGTNPFFAAHYALQRGQRAHAPYSVLVDHLNETGPASAAAAESLRVLLDRRVARAEVALLLLIRRRAENPPATLVSIYEELAKRKDMRELFSEYIAKFYNKV